MDYPRLPIASVINKQGYKYTVDLNERATLGSFDSLYKRISPELAIYRYRIPRHSTSRQCNKERYRVSKKNGTKNETGKRERYSKLIAGDEPNRVSADQLTESRISTCS